MQVRPMLQAEALTRLLQGAVLGAIFVMHVPWLVLRHRVAAAPRRLDDRGRHEVAAARRAIERCGAALF
jgi:hypothetical protein